MANDIPDKKTVDRIMGLLQEFFKDSPGKLGLWLSTPNPMLGNIKPFHMILWGREKKLLKFIESAIDENKIE
jgi:hypothetical protein